jgi:hypothetical protein
MGTSLQAIHSWTCWKIIQVNGYEEEDRLGGPIVPLISNIWPFSLGLRERPDIQPKYEYDAGRTQSKDHCSSCEWYRGHVAALLAGDGLQVGCMQNYR